MIDKVKVAYYMFLTPNWQIPYKLIDAKYLVWDMMRYGKDNRWEELTANGWL